jgi:2-methylcitrate dehydratase PrpD
MQETNMKSYCDQVLLEHLTWLDSQNLGDDDELIHKAKLILLDTLGCVYGAFHAEEIKTLESTYAAHDPGSHRIHKGPGLSMNAIIHLFAYAACWDEACEGNAVSHGRPGIATLAGMYPWLKQLTLKQFLVNFIKGYEISTKFAEMLRIKPGMHVDGNWPALGTAAAVGKCLGLANEEIVSALNLVASQIPMSLYLPIAQGANGRNSFLGHAAQLGVQSVLSIKAGIKAPQEAIVEYAKIALSIEKPMWNESRVMNISTTYIKPFAAVRHVHYGALAALALKDSIDIHKVEKIELKIYREATIYCSNRAPQTPIQAQFSLSYGLACALAKHHLDPNAYDDMTLQDPMVRKLEQCVEISIDEDLTRKGLRGATLTVHTSSGTVSHSLQSALGDIDQPMSDSSIVDKFCRYANAKLGFEFAKQISNSILLGHLNEECPHL